MAITDLIVNGGFETGTLHGWSAENVNIVADYSHAGSYSARFAYGAGRSSLIQTVPIDPGQSFQLFVSLSKLGFQNSPIILIRVHYLDANNVRVGRGLAIEVPYGGIPNVANSTWTNMYQITDDAPANATQAQVVIRKPMSAINAPMVFIDDVSLVEFGGGGGTGATGVTGTTGV